MIDASAIPEGEGGEAVYQVLSARLGEARPVRRLDATRRVVELLGDPHLAYRTIHVTGTNGKTSTSRMIESILRAHGLRTGLVTSPHLEKLNERIQIDGEPISDERLLANFNDIEPYIEMVDAELAAKGEPKLSYFEVLTSLAFACLADAPVDVAVIEVGMGGEWDSTNVIESDVAVFTPVDMDHAKFLGETVAEIARTKAGIIKPAAYVVSAEQKPEALAEIERAAELSEARIAVENAPREGGKPISLVKDTPAVGGQLITVQGLAAEYRDVPLSLFGPHQAHNAVVAIAASEAFLGGGEQPIPREILIDALGEVSSPGRLQIIATEPTVLVDAAHNPHGARALARALRESFSFGATIAVVGTLEGKDAAGIVTEIAPLASHIVLTQPTSDRAVDADELADVVTPAAAGVPVEVVPNLVEAVEVARALAEEAPVETEAGIDKPNAVVVLGSVILAGELIAIAREEGWLGE